MGLQNKKGLKISFYFSETNHVVIHLWNHQKARNWNSSGHSEGKIMQFSAPSLPVAWEYQEGLGSVIIIQNSLF